METTNSNASQRAMLAEKLYQLKQEVDKLNDQHEEKKKEYAKLNDEMVLLMENDSLKSFKDDRYGTFFLHDNLKASVKEENRAKAFAWLRENEMGDVITETVHHKRLSAIAQDYPDIPGVTTYIKTTVRIRKK